MKEFYKGELPLSITYSNYLYTYSEEHTALYAAGRLYNHRGCVLVKVVPHELLAKRKLNKKFPAQKYIFYNETSAKNKAAFRVHLNDYYARIPADLVFMELEYLTNKSRSQRILPATLQKAIDRKVIGEVLHRYDPESFNIRYNNWLLEPAF